MKAQRGFSLIEAMVAGVVSLLIPAVVIAVLNVSNRQIGSNSAQMRLAQIADAVVEDIHRAGLAATWVYSSSEAGAATCPATVPDAGLLTNQDGLVFCDKNKQILKGYRAVQIAVGSDRARIEEWKAGAWSTMTFSGDPVIVTYDPDPYNGFKAQGLFGLVANGGFGWYNFRFDMSVGGTRVYLPLQTESVVCRNAPSRIASW